jgi:hypothetical protein
MSSATYKVLGSRQSISCGAGVLSPALALDATRLESVADAWQSVVQVARGTETGEAPRWQGATTENTERI